MIRHFYQRASAEIDTLRQNHNLRNFPSVVPGDVVDLTTNDYLGIAQRGDLRDEFLGLIDSSCLLSASASRLLASCQVQFHALESLLYNLYQRRALLFNSGYHANVGIIQAIADKHTYIIADRLVHASIIDGIRLSGARFTRFPHNDFSRLEQLIEQVPADVDTILVVAESIYSMDGDCADIDRLIDIRDADPRVLLYIDEAHTFGVAGKNGLGLVNDAMHPDHVDILVGTLGKAAASTGAFAITSDVIREYLINRARSLIFSTALPPINVAWSRFVISRIPDMDSQRERLHQLCVTLDKYLHPKSSAFRNATIPTHIHPLIVGDAQRTLQLSKSLLTAGVNVLPIRTPTVPPGTERLRFSLSAALTDEDMAKVAAAIKQHLHCRI